MKQFSLPTLHYLYYCTDAVNLNIYKNFSHNIIYLDGLSYSETHDFRHITM